MARRNIVALKIQREALEEKWKEGVGNVEKLRDAWTRGWKGEWGWEQGRLEG